MNVELKQIRDIFKGISDFALNGLPKVENDTIQHKKDAADLVSNRDYVMESRIIEIIHRIFPDHTVISEEVGIIGDEQYAHQWLVDPIDGSCNDTHEIPWSSVSVAYVNSGQIVAGMVIHTSTGEVFEAIRGQGATLNGYPIEVKPAQRLRGSVVMTELLNQYPWMGMYDLIDFLAQEDATVRIMGSTALSIAQVAAGRAAAVILENGGAVDVTAGTLIAIEAGAKVLKNGTALEGLPSGRLIVAAPGVVNVLNEHTPMVE